MKNPSYKVSIEITRTTEREMNQYGDKEVAPATYAQLLDIKLEAKTLEKLQEKIKAHVDLVED